VSWRSQKQRVVALSSTESEYISMTEASREAIYLQDLLEEMELSVMVIGHGWYYSVRG